MPQQAVRYNTPIAIFIIWIFHAAAIIGISLGHQDWFIAKTPLNLILCLGLFIWVYPMDTLKKYLAFAIFVLAGMFAEWLGVQYGLLFGEYSYGSNFGPKLDGVPYLIGINWAILTFICAGIVFPLRPVWLKIPLASLLMVLLDFFMEHSAPNFDFWTFSEGLAGIENYVTWFTLALVFQSVFHAFGIQGNKAFSLNLYLTQLVFFGYFYFF